MLLSMFIYLSHFQIFDQTILKVINSINAILGFYLLLSSDKRRLFWSGFFIAIFWFYWIGFSFRFYDANYLIPLMIFFVAITYGVIFWIIGIFKSPFVKVLLILCISFIHPLSFNWFIPELTLVDSFVGIHKWQFGLFLLSIATFITLKSWYKIASIFLLIATINFTDYKKLELSQKVISISSTTVPQELKWEDSYRDESISNNLNTIYKAIRDKDEVIILPESSFALFLNIQPNLMNKLKELSKDIIIITGALYSDGYDSFNSTYYFINGDVKIAHKVYLVPFGEEIPLPSFLKDYINEIFYGGAKDYKTADKPTDIEIDGEIFRNAICYEATKEELYEGDPKFMIAMSNNAWFTPSIEPTVQNYLLRYFSIKHKTVIYHSSNRGGTALVK
jgi:apolipoprotein N-acyltransferase